MNSSAQKKVVYPDDLQGLKQEILNYLKWEAPTIPDRVKEGMAMDLALIAVAFDWQT